MTYIVTHINAAFGSVVSQAQAMFVLTCYTGMNSVMGLSRSHMGEGKGGFCSEFCKDLLFVAG